MDKIKNYGRVPTNSEPFTPSERFATIHGANGSLTVNAAEWNPALQKNADREVGDTLFSASFLPALLRRVNRQAGASSAVNALGRNYDRVPTDFSTAVTMDPSATSESIFWISS
jgi:hypothetical protein